MENSALQTAPPEHESRTHEKAAVSPEQVNDQNVRPLDCVFGGASADGENGAAARLLRNPSFSHPANGTVRTSAFKRAQQARGNHFVQRVVHGIQRKPAASGIVQHACSCGGTCDKCRTEEEALSPSLAESTEESTRLVQREAAGSTTLTTAESNGHDVIPSGSGDPLDERTRNFMESRFGADFSNVRVHNDNRAADSADALSANAYTVGRDIYFARGRYSPQTRESQHLLAHELTHTIQQTGVLAPSQSAMRASGGVIVGRVDDPLEKEADRAAEVVVNGASDGPLSHQATPRVVTLTVQRQEAPADQLCNHPKKFPLQEKPRHGREKEDDEKEKTVNGTSKAAGDFSTPVAIWQPARIPRISGSALSPIKPLFKRAPGANGCERQRHFLPDTYAPSNFPRQDGMTRQSFVVQRQAGIIPGSPLTLGPSPPARPLPPHVPESPRAAGHGAAVTAPPSSTGPTCWTGDVCSRPVPGSASEFSSRVAQQQAQGPQDPARPSATAVLQFANAAAPGLLAAAAKVIVNPNIRDTAGAQADPSTRTIEVPTALEREASEFNASPPAATVGSRSRADWSFNTVRILTHEMAHIRFALAPPSGLPKLGDVALSELDELNAMLSEFPLGYRHVMSMDIEDEVKAQRIDTAIATYIEKRGEGIRGILTKLRCMASCDDVNTSVRRVFEAQTASWPQQVRDVLLSALADPSNRLQWPMPPPPRAGLPPAPRSAGMGGIQRSTNPLVAMLPPRLQLAVSTPGDIHEQEADRVADMVMRMPSASGTIQRHCSCWGTCDKCEQDEEHRPIQRKSEGEGSAEFQGVLKTQGKPLATESQSRLETHFGADLSDVHVHTSSEASASAASLDALAYTSGRDIYFARGMYAPSTSSGDQLLAHEVAHVVQQSSGNEPSIAMKSARGVKIGAPDDDLEIQADRSAEEYMRGSSARGEERQKLPAPQSPAPIQRAPEPAAQSSQPAADPAVVQNAVDAVCKGIDDDRVDAVVAPMRGLSISVVASLRSGVLMRKTVLLERWLLKPHGDQKTLDDIASIVLIAVPSVVVRTKVTATAEEGLRLLWPALPLIDRLEVYDEGFWEIEQAQLDVIRQASLKERAEAQKQAAPRLFLVYSKMSAKEEFEARNLMDSSEVAKGDTAVRMIQRDDKDVVYDALMALDRVDRKFVFDQHYMELKDLLYRDEFNLVATLTHASEAQMIIARLRLATEDRKDDMEAVRAMVDRAMALLTERQQLREARSARLLTANDRARIDERLQELDDLDVLLQFKRTAKGNLKENTFMALLADAEDQQAAFGSHMDRLAQFSSNRRAFALEAAKQRVLIAGSNQDELRSILLTTHAPVDPKDKTKRTDLKQWEEDIEFRKELLSDPEVHKVFVSLRGSEQMHVLTALEGDAFDDALERLNQMKNAALWGEFFDLIRTVARNDEWRTRFEKTKTEYWSLYAFVSGEEREIMETILHDPEHRIPITKLLRYTGKVSTLKAAFAHLQENEREQLRTGWAMANHPFIGPRTEPQDNALAAFRQFEEELKKSQGSDKEGYETVLATVLGTAPTKSEMATGQGRYNAAAILAERVAKRLGLARGIAADFSETDETMDAAGRQFAALWLRLKDQPELSIIEYATLSTLYQQFEHRAEEFSEAAKAITDMAGTIAATLAGIVVVVATGGVATPAVVAMAATAGAAGGFIAREAFGGDYYTAMSSEGERALLLDSINGALAMLSGSLAARGVELVGLSGGALAQGMVRVGEGAVQEAAQSLGRKALVSGVEAALDGLISGTISEAAGTFTDDRTWREGIMEGLARVGKSALLGGLFGLAGGAALGSAMPVVGRAAGGLRKALTASSLEKSLIRAGMGDILKSAQAAARSGDTHAVDRLIAQMEGHLAAEDAAVLRQQLREELTEVLGHPPGTAAPAEEERALLNASSAVEDGAKLTAEQKAAESNIVARSEPQISHEPGYVDEVDLGNGHVWRRTEEGTWCRFTQRSICGTKIPGARPFRTRARVGSSPPYDYRVVQVDYSSLPRDAARNIAPLPEGVVYEFPSGDRVWREGEAIRHDSVLGPGIGRRGTEKEIFSAGETGLPELAGMERAHTLGQGTGFESPFGIFFAPREVNQIIQNNGVEELLRGLRESARPGETFRVSTLTVPHSRSLRLKEVRYRVELVRNGKQDFMFEYVINIADIPNPIVTHEVASITQSTEVASYFDLVDVPERLRTRFARFRRR